MRMHDPQASLATTGKRDASRENMDSYDASLPVMDYIYKRCLADMRATLNMYQKSRAQKGSDEPIREVLSEYDRPLDVFAYMVKVQRRQIAAAVELYKSRRHNAVHSDLE
jgi:hypothetical protein